MHYEHKQISIHIYNILYFNFLTLQYGKIGNSEIMNFVALKQITQIKLLQTVNNLSTVEPCGFVTPQAHTNNFITP